MKRQLVYIGFAFSHHKGTHAGYHQIRNHLNYDYIIDCQKFIERISLRDSDGSIFRKLCINLSYRVYRIIYIFHIFWLGFTHNNLVFHFIYGENTFYPQIKRFLRKGNIIVCTFHQPFAFFEKSERQKIKILASDHLILVSNTEVNLFENMTGKKNVHYIPHGIDTTFYQPDINEKKTNMVLTVGNWLRDYDFANNVYQKILEQNENITIHVVANKWVENKLTGNSQLFFHHDISDEELLHLYRISGVLFLPLIRYTANNSLLEAGATGCNIVVASDVPDNSYIPSSLLGLIPLDIDKAVSKIKETLGQSYRDDLSAFVNENYSWKIIANETKKLLESL